MKKTTVARIKDKNTYADTMAIRNFRCQDRLWELAQQRAKADKITVSDVIREALTEYVTK